MRIIYDPNNGIPIADGDVEDTCEILCKVVLATDDLDIYAWDDDKGNCVFSTENIILRLRLALVRRELKEPLIFIFEGKELTMDEYGFVSPWPKGFLTQGAELSRQILYAIGAKRKAARK